MVEFPAPLLQAAILENTRFVEASFQGTRRAGEVSWERVTIRPVLIKDTRHWQFVYFDGTQTTTKNYLAQEAKGPLDDLIAHPFKSIQAITTEETIRVQFSKKGRPIVHHEPRGKQPVPLDLAHDRAKPGILSEHQPAPFLNVIGVTTSDGRVRADQQRKFRQINEFLRLVEETNEVERLASRPVHVVDLGCGSAALTFATYHYLNTIRNIPATLTGVDTKAYLLDRHRATAAQLGWDGMSFEAGRILDFEPGHLPDIVLALHACDTATDEALARAIKWGSSLIFSAPCCHHHLQAQLATNETPGAFRPVVRHGILRERMGDILTDAFRAQILRLLGYRTDVIEFVAVEHTPKNLMIRAVRVDAPLPANLLEEYSALKSYWGVTPYLEELLVEEMDSVLAGTVR